MLLFSVARRLGGRLQMRLRRQILGKLIIDVAESHPETTLEDPTAEDDAKTECRP